MSEMALDAVRSHPYYQDEDVCEQVADRAIDLNTLWSALPDDTAKIPDDGAWILVREQPHTAIPSPPLYSIWRARPVYYVWTVKKVRAGGRMRTVKWPLIRARIATPHGELTLLPGEYTVVRDLRKWLDLLGEGVTMNVIGPIGADTLTERIFYLQSRGLRRGEVVELLLPEVTEQDVAWLSLDGTGAEEYLGVKS